MAGISTRCPQPGRNESKDEKKNIQDAEWMECYHMPGFRVLYYIRSTVIDEAKARDSHRSSGTKKSFGTKAKL